MDPIPFIDLKKQYEALKPRLEKALLAVAASVQFIGGPLIDQLEKALAEYVGASECVTCANGTDALILPLLAFDVGPGDAVFCPSFTFIATAEVAALRGATPVFVDIDPLTYNMSPEDLSEKIERVEKAGRLKPKVVIPVDLFGLPADFAKINAVAKKRDLLVLEDAAQGFGGLVSGQRAGSLAAIGATSFFPAKPLGCYGDGGAIFVSDRELADVFRSLRGHGAGQSKYEHVRLGVNSRLDALQAAVLLEKLAIFPQELLARQVAAREYGRRLEGRVGLPFVPEGSLSSWAQYTIRVPAGSRDFLIERLKAHGVPTNVYYPMGLHRQPAFRTLEGIEKGPEADCPETDKAAKEVLSLPMHPYLEEAIIDRICSLVIEGLELGAKNV
jgi:dTDP-4-amino-4,6-dideoxygalactose transaminase